MSRTISTQARTTRALASGAGLAIGLFAATPAMAVGAVAEQFKWLTFLVFGLIIAATELHVRQNTGLHAGGASEH